MAPQQNGVDSLTNAPTFNPPTNNDEPSQNSQQVPQNGPQMPPPSSGPNRFSLKSNLISQFSFDLIDFNYSFLY